jgi:hypothetical protein
MEKSCCGIHFLQVTIMVREGIQVRIRPGPNSRPVAVLQRFAY